PGRRWAIPLAAAAVVLTGVAAVLFGTRTDGPEAAAAAGALSPPAVAAAAPARSAARVLRVGSVPAGAEVSLDGTALPEVTPAPVSLEGDGPFTLRISKRGFRPREVRLTAEEIAGGTVSYTLAAAEVPRLGVTITSAYPVEVVSGSQT